MAFAVVENLYLLELALAGVTAKAKSHQAGIAKTRAFG
jgi:hypothetical protein